MVRKDCGGSGAFFLIEASMCFHCSSSIWLRYEELCFVFTLIRQQNVYPHMKHPACPPSSTSPFCRRRVAEHNSGWHVPVVCNDNTPSPRWGRPPATTTALQTAEGRSPATRSLDPRASWAVLLRIVLWWIFLILLLCPEINNPLVLKTMAKGSLHFRKNRSI